MCGRYAFYSPREAIADIFGVDEPPEIDPRYNIAPTQYVPVIRARPDGARSVSMLRWGLIPFWARDPAIGNRMINARAETIGEKPAFKYAFSKRRCLLPATGFYEWKSEAAGKQPYFIHAPDERPFAFAGLWERWQPKHDAEAEPIESCTIITTSPNAFMADLHDRMPVILEEHEHGHWLSQGDEGLLRPFGGTLQARVVSRDVNNPRNESPALVQKAN